MVCSHSLTTKTGTFTFYDERLTKCEAELKCMKMGQILAPVSNRRDAKKIVKMFEKNDYECVFTKMDAKAYWIGLDSKLVEDKQEIVFSDGVKWNEKYHKKIYNKVMQLEYENCPAALFTPTIDEDPFHITNESSGCNGNRKARYFCLKPAGNSSAESVVQGSMTDSITLSPIGAAVSVFLFVTVSIAAAYFYYKNRKVVAENESLREAQTGSTENGFMVGTTMDVKKEFF